MGSAYTYIYKSVAILQKILLLKKCTQKNQVDIKRWLAGPETEILGSSSSRERAASGRISGFGPRVQAVSR